ncbi:hypothetical protein OSTOST_01210, partial [Ostertagia ostertagi]
MWEEVENAVKQIKAGKSPGCDNIRPKHLKAGGLHLFKALAEPTEVDGKTIREAAEFAGVNASTARNIVSAYRWEGAIVHRPCGGSRRIKLTSDVLQTIEEIVERHPEDNLVQMQRRLKEDDINLAVSTIFNALLKLKITLKKSHHELDRVNSTTTIASRQAYALDFTAHAPQDKEKCIFIDEFGFNLHLRRTQARSKRERAKTRQRCTTNRIVHSKIINDGTCNSPKFCAFIEELLAEIHDREEMNGAWLILDKAKIHKTEEVLRLLDDTPYQLKFFSPYSYMLSPAENVFSK